MFNFEGFPRPPWRRTARQLAWMGAFYVLLGVILFALASLSDSAQAETRSYPSRTGWQVEFHWPPGSAPQVFDATNWSTGRAITCIADGSGFVGLAFNNVNGEHDFVVLEVPAKYRSGRHWCVRLGQRLARGKGPWPQGMRAEP